MKECDEIQAKMLGYIECELSDDMCQDIESHLDKCCICKEELKALRLTRQKIMKFEVDDPGSQFWDSFPDQVLASAKQEQRAQEVSGSTKVVPIRASRPPVYIFAQAAAILIVAGSILLFVFDGQNESALDSTSVLQAEHQVQQNRAEIASTLLFQSGQHFGFSQTASATVLFFQIGTLYAETSALILGHDRELIAQQFERLNALVDRLPESSKAVSALSAFRDTGSDTYSKSETLTSFSQFHTLLEQFAVDAGEEELLLFRTGVALFETAVDVVAGNPLAARRSTLERTLGQFKQYHYPPGVERQLSGLIGLMGQETLSDRDKHRLLNHVKALQALLG